VFCFDRRRSGPSPKSDPNRIALCPHAPSICEIKPTNAGRTLSLGDVETKADLRKLADEYIVQAEEIEGKENKAALRSMEPSRQGSL